MTDQRSPEAESRATHSRPEDSIRALMVDEDRDLFDDRVRRLLEGDPSTWEGIAFPIELGVELAAVCNLRCVMCPVPTTSRPPQLMKSGTFERVIEQAASEGGFVLLPQGFGETMLHARWAELVGSAAERRIRPIVMLTNGTVLDERNIERVLALGIDALVISIDGTTPETYARVRVGGDLRRVEANVLRLIERRGQRRTPKICMRIIRMRDTAQEIDAFLTRWRGLLHPEDEVRINEYTDWSGKVDDLSVEGLRDGVGRGPCRMLWRNLSVHADGKVSACCHDSEDELIVGDLELGETLQQVWRGEKLQRLRRLHLEGRLETLPICRTCKAWY
jgi:radical SAM protein with 4Fe4S-binding SPASM domain